jgi:hypothetical protein
MKNKNNALLSEELGKMSRLFHYQQGIIISEQNIDISRDVGLMMKQLDAFNTNEEAVVNIIKRYTNKQDFQNFITQYKTITGKDFGVGLYKAINPAMDKKEWGDLKTHLSKIGIELNSTTTNKGKSSIATFGGLDTSSTTPVVDAGDRQKNINNIYCGVRGGNITGGIFKGKPWGSYKTKYNITDKEEQIAKQSCSKVSSEGGNREKIKLQNQNITNEIQRTIGVPETGSLDVQSIEKLIAMLSDVGRPKVQPLNQLTPAEIKQPDTGEQLRQFASQQTIKQ